MSTTSESTQNIYGELPSTWQLTTLGELIKIKKMELQTGPFGTMLHASSYKDYGTPVLAVQHIGNNRIIHGLDIPRVDEETHQRLARYEIKVNDIIFCRKGAVERTALVTDKENGWLQGSDCIRLRLIDPLINPIYISYVFCSNQYKKWIVQHAHGATMPSLNQQIISLSPLALPPIEEQKQIADVLSCLDAKIENLRRQNETLEQIAQTLFKHWFIDFEFPNADGKPYKSSGGAMFASELGDIPEGWKVGELGEFTDISIGRTPPRKDIEWFSTNPKDIKWVSIRDMGNCGIYIINTSEYLTQEAIDKFNIPVIPEDTVILSFKLTVGRVAITTEKMLSNEAIAHIKLIDNYLNTEYLYLFLKQYNFSFLGSTSSIATAVNSKSIKSISVLIPSKQVITAFRKNISSVFQKIKLNTKQIATLTKTRDSLLPKLMSGQLRVKP